MRMIMSFLCFCFIIFEARPMWSLFGSKTHYESVMIDTSQAGEMSIGVDSIMTVADLKEKLAEKGINTGDSDLEMRAVIPVWIWRWRLPIGMLGLAVSRALTDDQNVRNITQVYKTDYFEFYAPYKTDGRK